MSDDTYNGWPNRETWAVFTWVTSCEEQYATAAQYLGPLLAAGERAKAAWLLRDYFTALWADVADGVETRRETFLMLEDIGSLWRVQWGAVVDALGESLDLQEHSELQEGCHESD